MARKKISTTVYLEPSQVRDLKALSDLTRVPQAVLIRDALQDYLNGRRHEIPNPSPDPRQLDLKLGETHGQKADSSGGFYQ